jgi:hypothetical protein
MQVVSYLCVAMVAASEVKAASESLHILFLHGALENLQARVEICL